MNGDRVLDEMTKDMTSLLPEIPIPDLEVPDMDVKRQERIDRNRSLMKTINPSVAAKVLPPEESTLTSEEQAAITIQRYIRGFLARREFVLLLLNKFKQEEEKQRVKIMKQMDEGQLLVENHKLEVLLDDSRTTYRNKQRLLISNVITIQRAWRSYVHRTCHDTKPDNCKNDIVTMVPQSRDTNESPLPETLINRANKLDLMSDSKTEESALTPDSNLKNCTKTGWLESESQHVPCRVLEGLQDGESDSVASDYSELGAPLNDLTQEELDQTVVEPDPLAVPLEQDIYESDLQEQWAGETEEEYTKRLRKINLLSLAQEFAELKKIDADALPFNLHKDTQMLSSPVSDESSADSAISTPVDSASDKLSGNMDGNVIDSRNYASDGRKLSNGTMKEKNNDGVINFLSNSLMSKSQISSSSSHQNNSTTKNMSSVCQNKNTSNSNRTSKYNRDSLPRNAKFALRGNMSEVDMDTGDNTLPKNFIKDDKKSVKSLAPNKTASSSNDTISDSALGDDFDVYTLETSMPPMDWDTLEKQLQMAADEERTRREARRNDREEIRRRLAMGGDEEYYGGERTWRKPSLQTRLQGGMNLQICFMNESPADGMDEMAGNQTNATTMSGCGKDIHLDSGDIFSERTSVTNVDSESLMTTTSSNHNHHQNHLLLHPVGKSSSSRHKSDKRRQHPEEISKASVTGLGQSLTHNDSEDEDFTRKEARLREEAKVALAQASTMAHMQLEVERQLKRHSSIADVVGIPGLPETTGTRLTLKFLHTMNLAQIQVLVNDRHTQIENLNEELVTLLVERDDLHMEQDSMLVDIEDLTRRAQEQSEKIDKKKQERQQKHSILDKRK